MHFSNCGHRSAAMELDPRAAAACQQSFKAKRSYKIIRLQIDPGAPSMVVSGLFGNILSLTNRFGGRPAFLVLELSIKRRFGVVDMELPEDYILCAAGSDAAPQNNLASATRSFTMGASFQGFSLALSRKPWKLFIRRERRGLSLVDRGGRENVPCTHPERQPCMGRTPSSQRGGRCCNTYKG